MRWFALPTAAMAVTVSVADCAMDPEGEDEQFST
jgi:hypothetical protein